ncbi:putative mediator of RNA polymerase II transcription subunit 12 [Daktulosphaira vitifoliae]|uniref:putative mediator of RNA polymerase II transcription subunit 12 n=1 Tax=Daktulosphaira vitifoliae TaxID=58002 RepID=UPI0021AA95D2|nr:putative mediator of RNA polymerase II transcription subunit 12 [Daktulosphaira vitifoliae]
MYFKSLWGVFFTTLFITSTIVDCRRVSIKAAEENEEDDQPQQFEEDRPRQLKPVLVARRPLRPLVAADGERDPVQVVVRQAPRQLLQQRPTADEEEESPEQPPIVAIRQPNRSLQQQRAPQQQQFSQQRHKEQQQEKKEPTAQTIRNYNKLNDDGSFTFGYEADDGSFKEETRGTDCVVRGKYGYVDPDGNKREFTYVQGNPCDPNAINDDEEEQPAKSDEEENIPANIPANFPKPKPKKNRPTTTLFQQQFGDFEPQQPSTTPRQPGRQVSETPRLPQISPTSDRPSTTASPLKPTLRPAEDLESVFRAVSQPSSPNAIQTGPNQPVYTTELVFDPATGQYNTVIYQQVPKQQVGISSKQRLPSSLPSQQFDTQPSLPFRPSPAVPHFQPEFVPQRAEFGFQRPASFPGPSPQQQLIEQQQSLMFQQSQNLFRQHQQAQKQQLLQPFASSQPFPAQPSFQAQQRFPAQQPFRSQSFQFFPPPSQGQRFAPPPKQQRFEQQPEAQQQQFVLVQPGRTSSQQNLANGQIDAFLRGQNVQF